MKKIRFLLVWAVFYLISTHAYAGTTTICTKITTIEIPGQNTQTYQGIGDVILVVAEKEITLSGCNSSAGFIYKTEEAQYALILSAYFSNDPLEFSIFDNEKKYNICRIELVRARKECP